MNGYALLVRPCELLGGSYDIRASLVAMDDGHNSTGDYSYEDRYLSAFLVSGYVDPTITDQGVYGIRAWFSEVYSVELDNAEKMTKLLRKIQRGMDKLNDTEGYVKGGDFFAYLMRIARVLGVKTIYVRNTYKLREIRGELYTRTSGSDLQAYIDAAVDNISSGRVHLYGN